MAEKDLELEIAHVLFMDIVGFTRLKTDEQPQIVSELQTIVRETPTFRRAEAAGNLIRLPRGDGMALAFFRDPVASVQCAVEVARELLSRPHIPLRMGIHSGPVYRVADINMNQDISGDGVNIAQRVMDCGDAGHILLSRIVADVLAQLSVWASHLYDLGEAEVKHGVRVHLFNFYTGEVGNPKAPEKLRAGLTRQHPETEQNGHSSVLPHRTESSTIQVKSFHPHLPPSPQTGELLPSPSPSPQPSPVKGERGWVEGPGVRSPFKGEENIRKGQIALLYKRNLQPDERLLKLLETRLVQRGYKVFIDRHMAVGLEWAKEIERQIQSSDAVIPLISEGAMYSEMLACEVRIAHEAAQQQGRPRLLPIRIYYEGPLPEELATILNPIHYTLWSGPYDDERIVGEIFRALEDSTSFEGMMRPIPTLEPTGRLHPPGGSMPLDSKLYIVRLTDEEFYDALARQDSIVLIKGARQMGKTSLLARGLQRARELGAKVVVTDFQELGAAQLESAEAFFLALVDFIAEQLDLDVLPEEEWNPRRAPSVNFERYIRRSVLPKISAPFVWGLDEVERLFTCDFGSEVFGLLRSWHNKRSLDPRGPWRQLTLAISYATEASLFIADINQSPFNVGTRIELQDFTFEQVAEMNRRYDAPLKSEGEVARYMRLVGGSPYLVHRGVHEMVSRRIDLTALESQADRDDGIFGDHLRRILMLLVRDAELCDAVRAVLRGQPCPTPQSFYRLKAAGVMSGDSARNARPRCQLYANYLERHLL